MLLPGSIKVSEVRNGRVMYSWPVCCALHCVWTLLPPQSCSLVLRLFRSHSLLYSCCPSCIVVRRVGASNFRWSLFRLQEAIYRTTCENKPNSQTDSWPVCLHTAHSRDHHGRCSPLRMYFHPTILRSEQYLEQSDLLHVRLPVPRVHHLDNHLLRDHDSTLLLPSMCGGLSLVVAEFPYLWLHSLLFGNLLRPLLHN